jgi:hypothetical protein
LIDWCNTSLKFSPYYDESTVSTLLETILDPVAVSLATEMTELPAALVFPPSISLASSPEPAPSMEIPLVSVLNPVVLFMVLLEAPVPHPFTSAPLVSMVNGAAFYVIIHNKGTIQYTLYASPVEETNSFSTSTELDFMNLSDILSKHLIGSDQLVKAWL